jgi:hypothetical protein
MPKLGEAQLHFSMSVPRLTITATLVVAAAIAATVVAAPTAFAGTFDVTSCSANSVASPPIALAGVDDAWTFVTDDPTHLESIDHCAPLDDAGIDGVVAETRLNSGGPLQGRFAQWEFDAPSGTVATRLQLWRSVGKRGNEWELYTRTADGTKLTSSDCTVPANAFTCTVSATADWSVIPATAGLRIGLACNDTSCLTGATLHEAWSAIYRAVVTIDDPTAPAAYGASGTVLAAGYVHGSVTAGVTSASDSTGIRALQVRAEGGRIAAASDRGCDYTRRVPCTNVASPEAFSFDSAQIGDGTHAISVGVVDAAQNFTAAGTQQITVDNTAPVAPTPTSPTAVMTADAATTIGWAEPVGQVAPITSARVTVCAPGGCQTATQPAGAGSGSTTVPLPAFGTYTVSVALQDAAGNFSPGQAAGWTITRPTPNGSGSVGPPATTPTPLTRPLPNTVRTSARLSVARPAVGRDRRTIAVRGAVAAGVTGHVTVTARAKIAGHTRERTKRATVRSRRYATRISLPSRAWRTATLTVRFPGDAGHLPARVTRRVDQRHG